MLNGDSPVSGHEGIEDALQEGVCLGIQRVIGGENGVGYIRQQRRRIVGGLHGTQVILGHVDAKPLPAGVVGQGQVRCH